ncbi:hypothetical protein L1987_32462 [Smallanthus sonchifolius]|uniref:Uncharacterized protein n=1 Tax=Smallanthus sonchifolius TaxID=185202 RepID=A0ACB9HNL6_9ASTR|nr:hypothetical protein L1987_32462 [Smallanthus sonchifolius]
MINSVNFTVSMMNFSNHRGMVIGLMQGYFQISGSLFMDLNKVFFQGHTGKFVIFMAVFPAVVSILCAGFIKIKTHAHPDNIVERGFRIRFIYSGIVIGVTIVIMGLLDSLYDFKKSYPWMVVVADVLLLVAISVPILVHVWTAASAPEVVVAPPPPVAAAGSLSFGAISDWALRHCGCGRPWFLTVSTVMMIGGHIVCRFGNLLIGLAIIGAFSGAYLGLIPVIAVELFSLEDCDIVLPALELAKGACSLLLSLSQWYSKTSPIRRSMVDAWEKIASSGLTGVMELFAWLHFCSH